MFKKEKLLKIKFNGNYIFQNIRNQDEKKIKKYIEDGDLNYIDNITKTWDLNIIEETSLKKGLRGPQIGGIYSIFSHWTYSNEPATIVMPTGTGKTETMLSITVKNRNNKTLVIVPTNSLREQIGEKFINLGKLEDILAVNSSCNKPIVGILKHKFKTKNDTEEYFKRCNVIVSTINIVGQQNEEIQKTISDMCSHLFIDEAHHIAAKTWLNFRKNFLNKKIIQFTATPFRRGKESIDGKIIYNYPLKKAQENGYFSKINFLPIKEFTEIESDKKISENAINVLETDLSKKFNHILMVRCENQKKAEYIYNNYYKQYKKHNPLLIHSGLSKAEQTKRLKILKDKKTNIVVCVDMLGEGYDLPNLKIAAMHDNFKSLGITLQFIGRFTRTFSSSITDKLGEATLISNIYNKDFENELSNLYAENSDWNYLISDKSTSAIQREIKLKEFIGNFDNTDFNELGVSLQNITPSFSGYFFKQEKKISSKIIIDSILNVFQNKDYIFKPNIKDNVYLVLTKEYSNPQWGKIKQLKELKYNLYIISYDEIEGILVIHSNEGYIAFKLAEKIGNNKIIAGEDPYKAFQGFKRLALSTVGLKDEIPGNISFRMYAGSDMEEALDRISKGKSKSNVFGYGYENGNQTSLGVSTKGKIWARLKGNILDWHNWGLFIGHKLNSKHILVNDILKNSVKRICVKKVPPKILLGIEWYEDLIFNNVSFIFGNKEEYISIENIDLKLEKYGRVKELIFSIESEDYKVKLKLEINEKGFKYIFIEGDSLKIEKGNKIYDNIIDFLLDNPPTFTFINNSTLVNNYFLEFDNNKEISSLNLIPVNFIDEGVIITNESQGKLKLSNSIQYNMIQKLIKDENNIIVFDDDSAGEIADIVVISEKNRELLFSLYHCKYSSKITPGARIEDLYEVCGQAQKSIKWFSKYQSLIDRLIYRENLRNIKGGPSRFEKGDIKILEIIKKKVEKLNSKLFINIVQPGISNIKISSDQKEILNATNNYLLDTFKIELGIYISDEN